MANRVLIRVLMCIVCAVCLAGAFGHATALAATLKASTVKASAIDSGQSYFIRNVQTGKGLAVAKGSRKAGAKVVFAKPKSAKAQVFRFVKKGSSYLLQNVRSGKYVGMSKGKLCQLAGKTGANKRWNPVLDSKTGAFYLELASGSRIDASKGALRLASAADAASQRFKLIPTYGFKVYLDAGHGKQPGGGYDPGAEGCGRVEATLTKDLVDRIEEELEDSDVKVVNGSKYRLAYWQRIKKANKLKCDVAVSVHFDAGGASGTSTMIGTSGPISKSKKLDKIVHAALVKSTGLRDRGTDRRSDITFVNGKVPSVLMEVAFIDNSSNLSKYLSRRDVVAESIANALVKASRVAKLQR